VKIVTSPFDKLRVRIGSEGFEQALILSLSKDEGV
jgi:hypothetical protein